MNQVSKYIDYRQNIRAKTNITPHILNAAMPHYSWMCVSWFEFQRLDWLTAGGFLKQGDFMLDLSTWCIIHKRKGKYENYWNIVHMEQD